jgi:hypothetical protein
MYSMSGDVVELPVGGVIRKKTSPEVRGRAAAGGGSAGGWGERGAGRAPASARLEPGRDRGSRLTPLCAFPAPPRPPPPRAGSRR